MFYDLKAWRATSQMTMARLPKMIPEISTTALLRPPLRCAIGSQSMLLAVVRMRPKARGGKPISFQINFM
jgi:hypothetical protein